MSRLEAAAEQLYQTVLQALLQVPTSLLSFIDADELQRALVYYAAAKKQIDDVGVTYQDEAWTNWETKALHEWIGNNPIRYAVLDLMRESSSAVVAADKIADYVKAWYRDLVLEQPAHDLVSTILRHVNWLEIVIDLKHDDGIAWKPADRLDEV